ncbi:MAG: response regulator [Candidatus Acidiferrales bacterium]
MSPRFKPKILVVEKDAATLRLFEATLKAMGALPRCVASGRQASEVINREKFDGVFLDWDGGEVGGPELTQCIRRSKSNKGIPVAMLTERRDTRAIADGFKAGATFYLQKPIGEKELARLLNASRGAMLEDRRRYQRAAVAMPVLCIWEQKQIKGQSVNLSSSGLLATLSPRPEVGAGVEIEFTLPKSSVTLTLDAKVTRHGPVGQAGIEFTRPGGVNAERLRAYVEKAVPGGPVSE